MKAGCGEKDEVKVQVGGGWAADHQVTLSRDAAVPLSPTLKLVD